MDVMIKPRTKVKSQLNKEYADKTKAVFEEQKNKLNKNAVKNKQF